MIRSAVRLPMPGHGLEAGRVAGGDRVQELARRAAGEHRERHLRAHALHADQHQEQLALLLGREAEEVHARRRAARGACAAAPPRPPAARPRASRPRPPGGSRRPPPRSRPRRAAGTSTSRAPRRSRAGFCARGRDAFRRAPAGSGAPFAWQIATASASAAWSGSRRLGQREQRADHPLHLVLVGRRRCRTPPA